jgi:hypothetical protein
MHAMCSEVAFGGFPDVPFERKRSLTAVCRLATHFLRSNLRILIQPSGPRILPHKRLGFRSFCPSVSIAGGNLQDRDAASEAVARAAAKYPTIETQFVRLRGPICPSDSGQPRYHC